MVTFESACITNILNKDCRQISNELLIYSNLCRLLWISKGNTT